MAGTQPIDLGDLSDFHPEDGWELVKRDFRFLMRPGQMDYDVATDLSNNLRNLWHSDCIEYLMLYNRHTSMLRFIATIDLRGDIENVNIKLWQAGREFGEFEDRFDNNSGIFSQLSDSILALDQHTAISQVLSPVTFINRCGHFFYGDFPLAYDPCVCYFESKLHATFSVNNPNEYQANGKGEGIASDIISEWAEGREKSWLHYASFNLDKNQGEGAYISVWPAGVYVRMMQLAETQRNQNLAAASYLLAKAVHEGSEGTNRNRYPFFIDIEPSEQTLRDAENLRFEQALKIAAPAFEFLSSQIRPNNWSRISPMVMESHLNLAINVVRGIDIECAELSFGTPGSKGADDLPEVLNVQDIDEPSRPTYNDPLGVFAMLETPVLRYSSVHRSGREVDFGGACTQQVIHPDRAPVRRYPIALDGGLNYAFNPRAQVNEEKTRIYLALEVVKPTGVFGLGADNMRSTPFSKSGGSYLTPFLPAACMSDFTAEITFDPYRNYPRCEEIRYDDFAMSDLECYLRVLIHYEFDAIGSDGDPLTDIKSYRYRMDTQSGYLLPATSGDIPNTLRYDLATTFSGAKVITRYAWYDIDILADLKVAPEVEKVQLIAGDGVFVSPDAQISPKIELLQGYPFACGPAPSPWTNDRIASFCKSGAYKANTTAPTGERQSIAELSNKSDLKVFPSPFEQQFSLMFELEKPGQVAISVMDLNGKTLVKPIRRSFTEGGKQHISLSGLEMPPGVYVVKLEQESGLSFTRIVKQ